MTVKSPAICACGAPEMSPEQLLNAKRDNVEQCQHGTYHLKSQFLPQREPATGDAKVIPAVNVSLRAHAVAVQEVWHLPIVKYYTPSEVRFIFIKADGNPAERIDLGLTKDSDVQVRNLTEKEVKQLQLYGNFDAAAVHAGDEFFDWAEDAVRMLKNREWAEQMPLGNSLLCDLETEISELVGLAGRFTEVQNKFAAAVSTLESLGYSYRVEGAAMWAPPHGSVPDFILWERGENPGLPPVKSQVVFDYQGRIGTGTVLGIGSKSVIIEEMLDLDGTEKAEEFCAELLEISIWPYSQVDHERAMELVEAMAEVKGQQRRPGGYYRLAFNLIKSGKI